MKKLRMSAEDKYLQIITVLENNAKSLAANTYASTNCFSVTVEALEKEFYNQQRYVQELWKRLRTINKMSDADIPKMDLFYHEAKVVVEELEMLFPTNVLLIQQISSFLAASSTVKPRGCG